MRFFQRYHAGLERLCGDVEEQREALEIIDPDWSAINNKPLVFPPSAHAHSADDITSGTLSDARLSSLIPRLNASNVGTLSADGLGTHRFGPGSVSTVEMTAGTVRSIASGGSYTEQTGGGVRSSGWLYLDSGAASSVMIRTDNANQNAVQFSADGSSTFYGPASFNATLRVGPIGSAAYSAIQLGDRGDIFSVYGSAFGSQHPVFSHKPIHFPSVAGRVWFAGGTTISENSTGTMQIGSSGGVNALGSLACHSIVLGGAGTITGTGAAGLTFGDSNDYIVFGASSNYYQGNQIFRGPISNDSGNVVINTPTVINAALTVSSNILLGGATNANVSASGIGLRNGHFLCSSVAANNDSHKLIGMNASDQVQIDLSGLGVNFGGGITCSAVQATELRSTNYIYYTNSTTLYTNVDGKMRLTNYAGSTGVWLDATVANALKIRNLANSANGSMYCGYLSADEFQSGLSWINTSGNCYLQGTTYFRHTSTGTVTCNVNGNTGDATFASLALSTDTRFQRPSAQTLQTQVYDSTLAAWQESTRSLASAVGVKWSVFGATPVIQPIAIPDTSGALLMAIEAEVNKIKQAIRSLGLIAA